MRMRAFGALLTVAATAALTSIAAPAQAAVGEIVGAGAAGALPGRYIVTLKTHPGSLMALDSVDLGGVRVLQRGGSVLTAAMSADRARRLAASPQVAYVEQDRMLHIEGTQVHPSWGLDRIDQRSATGSGTYTPSDDGSAVHAYVIDTGIRITHTEFGGRASYGQNFVPGGGTASDCNGHGTHVAGTIGGAHYGVAKRIKLVAVRVLNCTGAGSLSDVIAGVNWVTTNALRPAVANMSMGGGRSPSLEAAVRDSINSGITYAVAAGNENVNAQNSSPAGLAAAITVGATDVHDKRASFSDFGSVLDLFAPGVNIKSSVAGSDTATAMYSGTSMASPHVAGAAALVLDAYPSYSPAQVRNVLVAEATIGKITDPHGSPNRLLFVPAPAKAPAIATGQLTATRQSAYGGQLVLKGSRRGWWSLAAGALPAGLQLSSGGAIFGTPTMPGASAIKVRFTDYVPNTVTRTVLVTVRDSLPVIADSVLSAGVADTAYSEQLSVVDGRSGSWALDSGTLPDGLTLSASGAIEGVPTSVDGQIADFTVRAKSATFTDEVGDSTTHAFTLTVNHTASGRTR